MNMATRGSIQWYKEMAEKLSIATDNLFLLRMKQKYNLPMEWTLVQCIKWTEEESDRLIRKISLSLFMQEAYPTKKPDGVDNLEWLAESMLKLSKDNASQEFFRYGMVGNINEPISSWRKFDLRNGKVIGQIGELEDFNNKYRMMVSQAFGVPVKDIIIPPHNL